MRTNSGPTLIQPQLVPMPMEMMTAPPYYHIPVAIPPNAGAPNGARYTLEVPFYAAPRGMTIPEGVVYGVFPAGPVGHEAIYPPAPGEPYMYAPAPATVIPAPIIPPPFNSLGEGMNGEEDVELTCNDCGNKFLFSASEQVFFIQRGYRVPVRCKTCRNTANQARAAKQAAQSQLEEGDTLIGPCRSCQQQFVFTAGEREFFTERGFQDPVRCRNCRRSRRQQQQSSSSSQSPPSVTSPQQLSMSLEKLNINGAGDHDKPSDAADGDVSPHIDDKTTSTTTTALAAVDGGVAKSA